MFEKARVNTRAFYVSDGLLIGVVKKPNYWVIANLKNKLKTLSCLALLGSVHHSSVRKILRAKARLQGEKRSKIGHLARIFNVAGAFLSQKIATR